MKENETMKQVSIQLSPILAIRLLSYHEVELRDSLRVFNDAVNHCNDLLTDVAGDSVDFHHCVISKLHDALFGDN